MNPSSQHPKAEIPGPIAQVAHWRRRPFEWLKGERRFWPLFRFWLLPVGALLLLIGLVSGVSAWVGDDTVMTDSHPVHGWRGFAEAMEAVPLLTVVFAAIAAGCVWGDWKIRSWSGAVWRKVFGQTRKR